MVPESATTKTGRPHRVRTRLAAVAGAIAAATAVWLIARYGAGLQLRTPGLAPAQHPSSLPASSWPPARWRQRPAGPPS